MSPWASVVGADLGLWTSVISGPILESRRAKGQIFGGAGAGSPFSGQRPHAPMQRMPVYLPNMNTLLLVIVLLLLFGGGGFYIGGPAVGGGGLGLVLLVCIIIFLMGGFRAKQ
jgi:hypothetical protein